MTMQRAIDEADAVQKSYLKMRLVEDCLRRALDQLEEGSLTGAASRYVRQQVEKADGYLTDAMTLILSHPQFEG